MAFYLYVLAAIGFFLSVYAFTVEHKARQKNKKYKPVCDIRENISCTKAFTSPYGKLFGIPNSVGGMLFYPLVALLAYFALYQPVFYLALLSFAATLYLAYVSYIKLKNFCVVCTGVYAVNVLLLWAGYSLL